MKDFDLKAGRQRFTYEKKFLTAVVSKDASNPIDTRLRQIALMLKPEFDFKLEFYDKWAVVQTGPYGNMQLRKGRIKDFYFPDRLIRIKTRKGEDVIASFDKVITFSVHEP